MLRARTAVVGPEPTSVAALPVELRRLALRALRRMYLPERRCFAFRLRRPNGQDVLEGVSRRYTAMVLLGLVGEEAAASEQVLHGHTPQQVADTLAAEVDAMSDLGEVALTLWCLRAWGHGGVEAAWRRVLAFDPAHGSYPTVEFAWVLSALSAGGLLPGAEEYAAKLEQRLRASYQPRSGLFPHWPDAAQAVRWRAHISCFADLVYPIQALSLYSQAARHPQALDVAGHAADRMCQLQGPAGQWWWHFDVRTGHIVEEYPVYAVHQEAMAPMALFALEDAGGARHQSSTAGGLGWLGHSPELGGSLIDASADVVWRKVARREPAKVVRKAQAVLSRLHPAWRLPGADVLFPPGCVDYETRPYEMGWLLYAWPATRAEAWPAAGSATEDSGS
ncbi:MAG TPA: hypothetical protein PKK06_02545 [Phycisphaerae bacterium]|nr:hypothetical protein [Phycisphaerae bacterium]HNU44564.1 hypothetical protein [Phycisphaerae bacterium]